MKKYLEKKEKKYVIATLSNPTMYLYRKPQTSDYSFVENIVQANKFISRSAANVYLDLYYNDTCLNTELVVIPIEITYEIIEE